LCFFKDLFNETNTIFHEAVDRGERGEQNRGCGGQELISKVDVYASALQILLFM
jgi:hypothetical protein